MALPKIGGDLPGLNEIIYQLGQAIAPLNASTAALDTTVSRLVGDAGWNGDAASAFKGVWDEDAVAMSVFVNSLETTRSALSTLVGKLTSLQTQLDDAQGVAEQAGVRFSADGYPSPGQVLTGPAQAAFEQYLQRVSTADNLAQEARQNAQIDMASALAVVDPGASPDLLNSAGGSSLAGLMHDYFYMPTYVKQQALSNDIESLQDYYASLRMGGGGSLTRAERQIARADIRKVIKSVKGDLAAAEEYEAENLKGKWFNTSIADLLGLDKDASALNRVLDQVPGLDVVALTVGTWAQMKYDHERGWGWTHALVADGGANLVGVGVELVTAETGPLAPVLGYLSSSFVNEWTHSIPWTQDIHDNGVVVGLGLGFAEGTADVWSNDVVGMGKQIVDSVEHPLSAVKSMWDSVF
jgi:uncharacterized protein YukE